MRAVPPALAGARGALPAGGAVEHGGARPDRARPAVRRPRPPAERWLGHLRWLLVGLLCHVGATYLSELYLYWRIQEAVSSPRLIDARDIGVSYFVVGIVGVLTYHIPPRWRWLYVVAALVVFAVSLAVKRDFTQLGHFSALLIGLACYPLARSPRREPAAA